MAMTTSNSINVKALVLCITTPFLQTRLTKLPGFAVFVVQQLVGLLVICESFLFRIPVETRFRGKRYVGQQGERSRAVSRFHIAVGSLSALDTVAEVADMLESHSRIKPELFDLSSPDYETDILIIGGGGAG